MHKRAEEKLEINTSPRPRKIMQLLAHQIPFLTWNHICHSAMPAEINVRRKNIKLTKGRNHLNEGVVSGNEYSLLLIGHVIENRYKIKQI